MKRQVPELYKEYGQYINKFRSFPLLQDGLKIVERRILYSLYEKAREQFTKSAKVAGHCIGNYHPHSDASVYGTMVSMVSSKLAEGQGNWGSNIGIVECPAAASRYTEIRCSKEILNMSFEFIKYVDFEELEMDSEPVFLAAKFPFCLISANDCQGIGFGSRTVIPSYTKSDLTKRLKWLLGYRQSEPLIKPLSNATSLSKDPEFRRLLTTGSAQLIYKGNYETFGKQSIAITSLPNGKTFPTILKKLSKEISVDKSIGITDESSGRTGTCVRLTILRPRLCNIEKLKKKLNKLLISSSTYECNMCDRDGKVLLVSIDQMLLNVYANYKSVVERYLNTTISDIQTKIDEMVLIQKIKVVLPTHLQATPNDPEAIIRGCSSDTSIPMVRVKELFDKYNISRLLKVQVDIAKEQEDKLVYEAKLNNLETFIWDEKYAGES